MVWKPLADKLFKEYLESLKASHRHLLGNFSMQDLVFKVVGVGSVGTRCLVLLMTDAQDQPPSGPSRAAVKSVLAPDVPRGDRHSKKRQGRGGGDELTAGIQRIFFGTSTGPFGRHFYFRQFGDMKISPKSSCSISTCCDNTPACVAECLPGPSARSGWHDRQISA